MKPPNKTIFVDSREPPANLQLMKKLGFRAQSATLETGDYQCGEVTVERKDLMDLASSITDGRIHRQAERLAKKSVPIIFIHGKWKDIEKYASRGGITEEHISGQLSSLIVRYGIRSVIWTNSLTDGLVIIGKICEKVVDKKLDIMPLQRKTTHRGPQVDAICNLFKVSSKTARNLLEHYKTVYKILDVTAKEPDRLMCVEGIGPIARDRMHNILTKSWGK